MKIFLSIAATLSLTCALSAQAHDPSQHKEKAEKPDCAAMKGMDHSEMDADDPVMQAMMKKCSGQMPHGDHAGHGNHAGQGEDHGHGAEQGSEEK